MSRADVDDQPHNFKRIAGAITPLVEPMRSPVLTGQLDRVWWGLCKQTAAECFHAELLTAIVTGMMCTDAEQGMNILLGLVGEAISRRVAVVKRLPTELRPLGWDDPPTDRLPQWRRAL